MCRVVTNYIWLRHHVWVVSCCVGKDDVYTLRQRQNGLCFTNSILKCISLNEKFWIFIKISLKVVPMDPINNKSALIQIMAWRRSGDKPQCEPMMIYFTDAYMCDWASMSFVFLLHCWYLGLNLLNHLIRIELIEVDIHFMLVTVCWDKKGEVINSSHRLRPENGVS